MKFLTKLFFLLLSLIIMLSVSSCINPNVPDETPPQCVIIHPRDGQAVSGTIIVHVGAGDENPLSHVNLYIDGEEAESFTETPYEFTWDTTPIADNRDHTIRAAAFDESGNVGFSELVSVRVIQGSFPDTLAPQIEIINPVNGSIVRDTVSVIAQIVEEGKVTKVDYFIDGKIESSIESAPFEFSWDVSNYVDGSRHELFARAYDENLNVGYSNVISVTVQSDVVVDNTPPTLTILYPLPGSQFVQGDTINVSVDASDDNGIQRVEFYIDGALKLIDTSPAYDYTWDTSGYGVNQSHSIYVKVYDLAGNIASDLTSITLNP